MSLLRMAGREILQAEAVCLYTKLGFWNRGEKMTNKNQSFNFAAMLKFLCSVFLLSLSLSTPPLTC